MTQNVKLSTVKTQNDETFVKENAVENSIQHAETSTNEAVEANARNDGAGASQNNGADAGNIGNENEIQRAARRYRQAGLNILPAADKRPFGGTGTKWGQFTKVFCHTPIKDPFNQLALVCGAVSKNVEVIDFDFEGEDFEAWKKEVVKLGGDAYNNVLGALVIERTQSGGYHVGYRVEGNDVYASQKLTWRAKTFDSNDVQTDADGARVVEYKGKNINVDEQGRGSYCTIETKAKGGVVIVAPSLGSEPSTKYELIKNDWDKIPTIPKEVRDVLIQAALNLSDKEPDKKPTKTTRPVQSAKTSSSTPSNFPSINYSFKEPTDGQDDAASILRANLEYIVERLKAHGFDNYKTDEKKAYFFRPGANHRKSPDLILNLDGPYKESTKCFSPNAAPFEANVSYSPLQVVALLDFGGDENAASREVVNAYNAQPGRYAEYKNVDYSYLYGRKPKEEQDATEIKGVEETTDDDFEEEEDKKPTFPTECLPARLRAYVEYVAERKNISELTGALCSLPALSAVIGDLATIDRLPRLDWEKTNCSIKTALVASSGRGKTGILKAFVKPLKDIIVELKKQRERQEEEIWASGYDKKKRQLELEKLGRKAAYMPTNTTVEGLTEQIIINQNLKHCGTLLFADEGGGVFDFGAYKNGRGVHTEIASFIALLNGDGAENVRKGKDAQTSSSSFLSVLAGFQTKRLATQINSALIDTGLLSRFLITFEPDEPLEDFEDFEKEIPFDETIKANYKTTFDTIYAINKQVNPKNGDIFPFKLDVPNYQFSQEAEELLKAYKFEAKREAKKRENNDLINQFVEKSCYTVVRTALVFHFIKWTQRDDETLPENEKVQSDFIDFPEELYVKPIHTLEEQRRNDKQNKDNTSKDVSTDGANDDDKPNDEQRGKTVEVPTRVIDADTVQRAIELTRHSIEAAMIAYNEILLSSQAASGLKLTDEKTKTQVFKAIEKEQKGNQEAFVALSAIAGHIYKWKTPTKKDYWSKEKQKNFLKELVEERELETDSRGRFRIAL